MSEPDNSVATAGLARMTRLGTDVFRVQSGTVDVLAVDHDGVRIPLGSLSDGAAILPTPGVEILLSLGQDAIVQIVQRTDRDPESGYRRWVDLIVTNLRDPEAAAEVRAAAPGDLPDVVGAALRNELSARERDWSDYLARQVASDELQVQAAYRRNLELVADPTKTPEPPARTELLAALSRIGRFQGFDLADPGIPQDRAADPLTQLAEANGLRLRPVRIDLPGADKDPVSALLGTIDGSAPVALIPVNKRFWVYFPRYATFGPIDPATRERLGSTAKEITAPLMPDRAIRWRDLLKFGLGGNSGAIWLIATMALGISLLALATPLVTQAVLNFIIPTKSTQLLVGVGIALAAAAAVSAVYSAVQSFAVSRTIQKVNLRVQSAVWDRALAMPARFFREFSSGELTTRVLSVQQLTYTISSRMVTELFSVVFSLVSFALLFYYSVPLALITLVVLIGTVVYVLWLRHSLMLLARRSVTGQREATSWIVQLLTGISKIRVAGVERRLVAQHQDRIRVLVEVQAQQTIIAGRLQGYFLAAAALVPAAFYLGIYLFQWGASGAEIEPSTYLAFSTAFATVFGAFIAASNLMTPLASVGPTMDSARPILETLPEKRGDDPGRLRGDIEFSRVSFRYGPDMPLVLRDVSFHVAPGEFVALVGPSGSGKSSLLRLLLGFEQPDDGEVLVDSRVLSDLDPVAYRSRLGVVVQGGQLSETSVLENILAGSPYGESVAWKAAEDAAIADEIRAMPMGMQTLVDAATVSGGQAQRLLLARALVREPNVIILDEATSALDNDSQARVTESLNRLGATRIVVAHRLSTVVDADRIVVVVDGSVAEQGTYEELIATDGAFAQLVRRQMQ